MIGIVLLLLLIILVLGGLGFVIHALWWVAIVLFVIWLAGLVFGRGNWYGRR